MKRIIAALLVTALLVPLACATADRRDERGSGRGADSLDRQRFERERAEAMHTSLYEVLLRLPPSTVMYPGHDYGEVPWKTLGEEREVNPFLMTRDIRSFLSLFS